MVEYREVVRVLGVAREDVLARFAAAGGVRDRWQRRDREAMADALARTSDRLELVNSRSREAVEARSELRGVRRRLELELWP